MKTLNIYNFDELTEDVQREVLNRIVKSEDYNLDMRIALKDFLDEEINDIGGGFVTNERECVITDVVNFLDEIYRYDNKHDTELNVQLNCACAWEHMGKITISDYLTNVGIETFLDNPNFNSLIEEFREDIKYWLGNIKKELKEKEEKFIKDYKSRTCLEDYIYRHDMFFTKDGEDVKIGRD